jgi:hypothetical protein
MKQNSFRDFEQTRKSLMLWSSIWHFDDVLSINKGHFHSYVDSIYPCELEIKGITESSTCASYLDILLKIEAIGKLTTQLYDKRDDFKFFIVNFPYLCSYIPLIPAYGVYISQCIWFVLHMTDF